MQDTLNFLNECQKNRRVTQAACAALDKAGVIEKWPLQIKRGKDEDPVQVDGLYRISEKTLNDLDGEAFAGLRSHGAIGLAYAQLFSMNQTTRLGELAKLHARQAQTQKQKNEQPDIEKLFGEDDILSFDNI